MYAEIIFQRDQGNSWVRYNGTKDVTWSRIYCNHKFKTYEDALKEVEKDMTNDDKLWSLAGQLQYFICEI